QVFNDVEYNFTDKWFFVSCRGAEKERKDESNLVYSFLIKITVTKIKITYVNLKPLKPLIT
ncbi:MAG: hypothetical protein ACKPFJ_16505, partial [Dolichospermum sp.]